MIKTITITYNNKTFQRKLDSKYLQDPILSQNIIKAMKTTFAIRLVFELWQQVDLLRIDLYSSYRNVPVKQRKAFNKQCLDKIKRMTINIT